MNQKSPNAWQLRLVQLLVRFQVSIVIFALTLAGPAGAAPMHVETFVLVKALEQNPKFLFDMHGNAHASLQRLMVLRFHATLTTQAAIDRMEGDPARAELVAALYRVLGFVKDPASVPWLERKLRGPQRQAVHQGYMQSWHDGIGYGFGNNEGFGGWPWLTGREQWIAFFIAAHATEPSSDRRVELMNILKGFDDPQAMRFFIATRESTVDPREVLLVEAYLHQHEVPVDKRRIVLAVDALTGDSKNRDLLIGTADALRHEAFVPYLIGTLEVADPHVYPQQFLSLHVLHNLTLQFDLKSSADWNSWYLKHRGESREQWVQSAIESFKKRLASDPVGAHQWFKEAKHPWNDMSALPLIRSDLLRRPEFHSEIAGWINMTYSEFYRPRLKPVADELLQHPEQLEDWARELLEERRFVRSSTPMSWENYVRRLNMRM